MTLLISNLNHVRSNFNVRPFRNDNNQISLNRQQLLNLDQYCTRLAQRFNKDRSLLAFLLRVAARLKAKLLSDLLQNQRYVTFLVVNWIPFFFAFGIRLG